MEWEIKRIKKTEGPVMSLSPVFEAGAGLRDITCHTWPRATIASVFGWPEATLATTLWFC